MVAEADDKLMEKFFEEGTLTQEELVAGLRTAVLARKIFPLFCTSSILNIGVHPLLDAFIAYVPAPAERAGQGQPRAARRSRSRAADGGPVRRVRLEDRRRPVRRPHQHVPRHERRR